MKKFTNGINFAKLAINDFAPALNSEIKILQIQKKGSYPTKKNNELILLVMNNHILALSSLSKELE